MVAKVISELKSISRLKIFPETGHSSSVICLSSRFSVSSIQTKIKFSDIRQRSFSQKAAHGV